MSRVCLSSRVCVCVCVQSACEGCLPLLLEKLGDANTRLRDASRESILFIAGLREAGGLRSYTHVLVKPIKNPNAAKLILGVLSILQVGLRTHTYTHSPVFQLATAHTATRARGGARKRTACVSADGGQKRAEKSGADCVCVCVCVITGAGSSDRYRQGGSRGL